MYADVAYQQQLLQLVGHLYTQHVLPGRPPDKKTFSSSRDVAEVHRDFVRKTKELAAGAECILEWSSSGSEGREVTNGSCTAAFWSL